MATIPQNSFKAFDTSCYLFPRQTLFFWKTNKRNSILKEEGFPVEKVDSSSKAVERWKTMI